MAKTLSFFGSAIPSQFQSSRPSTILSNCKTTRISLIKCRLVRQDVDSNTRLSLDKWVKKNDEVVRVAPAFLGGSSFLLVLLNRTLSGIAPVADASRIKEIKQKHYGSGLKIVNKNVLKKECDLASAQSRADVIALAMAATVVLTGLLWVSVKPKKLTPVELFGINCLRVDQSLPASAVMEVMWAWEALRDTTCCRALVIVFREYCVLQAGLASESEGEAKIVETSNLVKGSLCQAAWTSGKQSYLANLPLYPGRFELDFLPSNTQAAILQPIGDEGIMIVAGDTVRGFGPRDQAWILSIGEKLDATLGKSRQWQAVQVLKTDIAG